MLVIRGIRFIGGSPGWGSEASSTGCDCPCGDGAINSSCEGVASSLSSTLGLAALASVLVCAFLAAGALGAATTSTHAAFASGVLLPTLRFCALLLERTWGVTGAVNFCNRLHGLGRKLAVRIVFQVILECRFSLFRIFQVVTIDFADGKQRFHTVLAAGIFTAQEGQLSNGILKALGIVEDAALVVQQFGHGKNGNVSFRQRRRCVIDLAVEIDDLGVVLVFAVGFRSAQQVVTQAVGVFQH